MSELHFVDANILMYAVGSEHPLKNPSLKILEEIANGEIMAVTDTEVFQEVAYRYWAQKRWKKAVEILTNYRGLFTEIYSIGQEHLEDFFGLIDEYDFLSPRDAIHAAVMKVEGVKNIHTADRAFGRLPFVKAHFPS